MTLDASWDALVDVRPMGQHCCQMTVVWSAAARVLVDENERAIRALAGVPRGRRGNPPAIPVRRAVQLAPNWQRVQLECLVCN